MPMRVRVLLGLIVVALAVGLILWLVRSTPIGQPTPVGSPLPGGAPAVGGWTRLGDAPFARLEMATTAFDDRIWLAGGLNPDGSATDAVEVFDPASESWSDGPTLPAAVHHAALASDADRLVLVGGYAAPSFGPTDAVWILEPRADAWTPGPPLPEPRAAGALTFDGVRLVYGGGVGPGGVRSEVFALDGERWVEVGMLARPREHLAATSDGDGRVWFLGGRQGGLDSNLGDVDLVEGSEVTTLKAISPRGGVAAFFAPGIGACLSGGEAPLRAYTTVECVDGSGRITALPSMNDMRHGHGAGVVGDTAYVLLGGPTPGLSAQASVESLTIGR